MEFDYNVSPNNNNDNNNGNSNNDKSKNNNKCGFHNLPQNAESKSQKPNSDSKFRIQFDLDEQNFVK